MTNEELQNLEGIMPPEEIDEVINYDYEPQIETEIHTPTNPKLIDFKKLEERKEEQELTEHLQKNKNGGILATPYNLSQILHRDETLKGLFSYNEVSDKIYMARNLGQYAKGYNIEGVETYINVHISKNYDISYSSASVYEALVNEARNNPFNPTKDYFRDAYKAYDGKKRMDRVFIDYLGAEDNQITVKMTRIFFEGLVMKVKNPYIKFDRVLDLVGGQGVGKTWIMYKLAGFGQFYTDSISSFSDKDSLLEMTKNLIINDDEMTITNKTSFEELKSFISKTSISVRKAYARSSRDYPKGFVLVRSTNNHEYLRDKTGNRRFMTMAVDSKKRTKNVKDMTEDDVKQILGEAMHEFGNNENLTQDELLTQEELNEVQSPSQYITPEEESVREYLDNNPQITFLSTRSIIENALDIKNFANNPALGRKIAYYMSNMGGWTRLRKKIDGKTVWGYERVDE